MLLLFDIDGTLLLRASEAHREALCAALHRVYSIEVRGVTRVAAAGRTDTQIARYLAAAAGVDDERFDARLDRFQAACAAEFERCAPDSLAAHVAPGMLELLDKLFATREVTLSLLTGNYEPIARTKLQRAGIGGYFAEGQGAFGSDSEQRELLGPIARRRAGSAGTPYPREQTTIIGDTPLDIACARADGLRVIGIATGPHSTLELDHADHVVADAFELRALLEASE